jgi:hypothetical protein
MYSLFLLQACDIEPAFDKNELNSWREPSVIKAKFEDQVLDKKVLARLAPCLAGLPDFFLVQHTKMGNIYLLYIKYTKCPQNILNSLKIDQMDMECTNIFNCITLQNLPKLGFLV